MQIECFGEGPSLEHIHLFEEEMVMVIWDGFKILSGEKIALCLSDLQKSYISLCFELVNCKIFCDWLVLVCGFV